MADIDSNLPIRTLNDGAGATADVTVGLLNVANYRIDPLDMAGFTAVMDPMLAGVTGIEALATSILAGVTGIESSQANILAGITGLEASSTAILAGVTGLEASSISILAGVTGIESSQAGILAGITGLEASATAILAGVTGLEATSTAILAGVTGLEATSVSILAGVTGVEARLPAVLGATAMAASLSVAMATDQNAIPVYITSGASSTAVVGFTFGEAAYLGTVVNDYTPATAFVLNQVHASGSGRIKLEVFVGATASPALKWVGFNSTANPNVDIDCSEYKVTATTQKVQAVVTNYENGKAQDLYCTIVGDLV